MDGSAGEHFSGEQKALILRMQQRHPAGGPRHCRPGPHQLVVQQLSPIWCPPFKKMLPFVLGQPVSGPVHT